MPDEPTDRPDDAATPDVGLPPGFARIHEYPDDPIASEADEEPEEPLYRIPPGPPLPDRRKPLMIGGAVLVVAIIVVVVVLVSRDPKPKVLPTGHKRGQAAVSCGSGKAPSSPDGATLDLTTSAAIPLGAGHGVADLVETDTDLWVADDQGSSVLRIDPKSTKNRATIAMEGRPAAIAVRGDDVWVQTTSPDSLVHIDATKDAVRSATTTGGRILDLYAGTTGAWVTSASQGRNLVHVDSATDKVTRARLEAPSQILDERGSTLRVADALTGQVSEVDERTGKEAAVGKVKVLFTQGTLARTPSAYWFAASGTNRLTAVDPDTLKVLQQITLPIVAFDIVAGPHEIWILDESGEHVVRALPGHSAVTPYTTGARYRAMAVHESCLLFGSLDHPDTVTGRTLR
jgi:sugar lactone lactonase YvrE